MNQTKTMTASAENIEKLKALIQDDITDLLAQNIDAIAQELAANPDGKLSVGISCKLVAVKDRVFDTATLSYSRKFSDEIENSAELDDPEQPRLQIGAVETPPAKSGKGGKKTSGNPY